MTTNYVCSQSLHATILVQNGIGLSCSWWIVVARDIQSLTVVLIHFQTTCKFSPLACEHIGERNFSLLNRIDTLMILWRTGNVAKTFWLIFFGSMCYIKLTVIRRAHGGTRKCRVTKWETREEGRKNMYKSMRIWAMHNVLYNEEAVHTTMGKRLNWDCLTNNFPSVFSSLRKPHKGGENMVVSWWDWSQTSSLCTQYTLHITPYIVHSTYTGA